MKYQTTLVKMFNIFTGTPSNNISLMESTGVLVKGSAKRYMDVCDISAVNSYDLTKTFRATWHEVMSKPDYELRMDQLIHYTAGAVGLNYIPNENFGVSGGGSMPIRVVTEVTQEDAIKTVVDFINSGIAIESDTLVKLLQTLNDIGYEFGDQFKNKEMNILVADTLGILPKDPVDFLRFVCYKATGSAMLIKSKEVIEAVKQYNTDHLLLSYTMAFGKGRLAEVFNRFKPILLAMKGNKESRKIINDVSKLSKKHHKPLPANPLSVVTSKELDVDSGYVKNATVFALLRALQAIVLAGHAPEHHAYRIRNGKLFAKTGKKVRRLSVLEKNYDEIVAVLEKRINREGVTVYIPSNVDYAVPMSEKAFVGNFPELTKFTGKNLCVGMYWENSMGARDLDLSSVSVSGEKVGWNSSYNDGGVTYSGDITNAPDGAVEYLRIAKNANPVMIYLNVFAGSDDSEYDLIVGSSDEVERGMLKDVKFTARRVCSGRESILGFAQGTGKNAEFVVGNYTMNVGRVSYPTAHGKTALEALLFKNEHRLSLGSLLKDLGYTLVDSAEEADIDLTPASINKSTILNLFSGFNE